MDKTELFGILSNFNPWWAPGGDNPWPKRDFPPFHRAAFEPCRRYLEDKSLRRAILISGPRRVGKTTVLRQLARRFVEGGYNPKAVLYVSMEKYPLKEIRLADLVRLHREEMRLSREEETLLLFDEIHHAVDWSTEIKLLVDGALPLRIIATGSASVTHKQGIAESGVGRWIEVFMPPLSFYEYLSLRGETIPAAMSSTTLETLFKATSGELVLLRESLQSAWGPIEDAFYQYLEAGGFPESAQKNDVAFSHQLLHEDVVNGVLKKDMVTLFHVRKVNDLERLFLYLCLHTGGIFAEQTIAKEMRLSPVTLGNFIDALEQAYLIRRLMPVGQGGKRLLKARAKIHIVDASMRNAVLFRSLKQLKEAPEELGDVVETAVVRHLAHGFQTWPKPALSYWRDTKTEKEVDVIAEGQGGLLPVEVKYRRTSKPSAKDGLAVYCEKEKCPRAIWVTMDLEDFGAVHLSGLETDILRIPAAMLMLLLGQQESINI